MNKCVLILDDDPEILMVCKIILEQNNYMVQTRLFCDDIIKDCKEVSPDIILMDLWIPNIGGEKAVNLLKENASTVHIPIILFSASMGVDLVAERTHATGVLKKPFDINILLATIEKSLASITN